MWQPLSRLLEFLGRIRFRFDFFFRPEVTVGDPAAPDALDGTSWRRFASGEALHDLWSPLPDSVWAPFHCVTLFAALDRIHAPRVGPPPPSRNGVTPNVEIPPHARPGAPAPVWIAADALTILDLPGTWSVKAAAWLMSDYRFQPVCTFNHWPHPQGLLKPERILAELLFWAPRMAEWRRELRSDAPPVWLCDSERLGTRSGSPGQFDNRYFLEDAVLPGAAFLKQAQIGRVVYVTLNPGDAPVIDLEGYFADLEAAAISVRVVDLMDPQLTPREWIPRPARTFRAEGRGFKRSSAGGFGTTIPQPSSGG